MPWVKGKTGNPYGRPRILLPEIQRDIEKNKNVLKQMIIRYLGMTESQIQERQRDPELTFLERMLAQCMERVTNDGCVDGFRKLLEIPFGKLPEDDSFFQTTPEEQDIIMQFRTKVEELEGPNESESSRVP